MAEKKFLQQNPNCSNDGRNVMSTASASGGEGVFEEKWGQQRVDAAVAADKIPPEKLTPHPRPQEASI